MATSEEKVNITQNENSKSRRQDQGMNLFQYEYIIKRII